ncbi:MAG: hypothetical protein J6Q33_04550 [Alistipes sp.]|nr:hypothetical protein [Alistipes sp.]
MMITFLECDINISVTGTGDGCEGLESKKTITINGGDIIVASYDDGVWSKGSTLTTFTQSSTIQTIGSSSAGGPGGGPGGGGSPGGPGGGGGGWPW